VLPEDSLLVLYTDGLIESRQRDMDTGLDVMRKVLGDVRLGMDDSPHGASSSLEAICDILVEELLPERAEDDAALLVARTRGLAPTGSSAGTCPLSPQSSAKPAPGPPASSRPGVWKRSRSRPSSSSASWSPTRSATPSRPSSSA
jgi:hypothetical protein